MAKGNLRHVDSVKRSDQFSMNPLDIKVKWEDNPRVNYGDEEEWNELKNSIRNEGVKNPVQVYIEKGTGDVYLAQGYRRMKATLELINEGLKDLTSIKVEQIEYNEEEILQNHYTQNNTGKPLSDLEMGELLSKIKKLSDASDAEIARRFGMEAQKVTKLIAYIAEATTISKKMVAQKKISLASAMAVAKQANGSREQNRILKSATKEMEKSGSSKIKPAHLKMSGVTTTATATKSQAPDKGLDNLKKAIAFALTSQKKKIDVEFVERLESVIDLVEMEGTPEEIATLFNKVAVEA